MLFSRMKLNWKKMIIGVWVIFSVLVFILFYLIASDSYFNVQGSALGHAFGIIPKNLMSFFSLDNGNLAFKTTAFATVTYWLLVALGAVYVFRGNKT